MKNYFNFKKIDNQYLLTNDLGKYVFLSPEEFNIFIKNENELSERTREKLKSNYFLFDENINIFSERVKEMIRGNKAYLFKSTNLHIFVLTNVCNLECIYCQAKDETCISPNKMSIETAEKCVDFALSSPSRFMTFEFQGGEPLANFDVLKHIVQYAESRKKGKVISYSVVSNLTLLSNEIISFFKENNISVSASLDGPQIVHDINRPWKNGKGSYKYAIDGIKILKENGINVGAIQTTTKHSLSFPSEIIDQYVSIGQNSVFIRPLTCLGTAARVWDDIGYTAEEFLNFYEECLYYIIQLNLQGINICERHTIIFLRKILHSTSENYMELRSPCGASIGQLAYFYDGNIFTCDEGRMLHEMGYDNFLLGNVFDNSYDEIIQSPICKATCIASLLESQINCSDCVYQPYCGTCPVLNLAQENDIFMRKQNSYRCQIYSGMLKIIFSILKNGTEKEVAIMRGWVSNGKA